MTESESENTSADEQPPPPSGMLSREGWGIDNLGWKKIGKGASLGAAGNAGGYFLLAILKENLPALQNAGPNTEIALALTLGFMAGVVLNALRKYLVNYS